MPWKKIHDKQLMYLILVLLVSNFTLNLVKAINSSDKTIYI